MLGWLFLGLSRHGPATFRRPGPGPGCSAYGFVFIIYIVERLHNVCHLTCLAHPGPGVQLPVAPPGRRTCAAARPRCRHSTVSWLPLSPTSPGRSRRPSPPVLLPWVRLVGVTRLPRPSWSCTPGRLPVLPSTGPRPAHNVHVAGGHSLFPPGPSARRTCTTETRLMTVY